VQFVVLKDIFLEMQARNFLPKTNIFIFFLVFYNHIFGFGSH